MGHGSRFIVTLPVAESAAAEAAPPATAAAPPGPRPTRFLIVDDNDDAAQSLALVLRLEGHEVRTATDGDAALACSTISFPRRRCSTSACRR